MLVCRNFLSDFIAPTESPWGPADGEKMELFKPIRHQATKSKKILEPRLTLEKTGEYLEYFEIKCNTWSERFTLLSTQCPACRIHGSLKVEFSNADKCPKCKTIYLSCEGAT
jgi:hypothetical protein